MKHPVGNAATMRCASLILIMANTSFTSHFISVKSNSCEHDIVEMRGDEECEQDDEFESC